jgi:multisubunit Na+/H+ antiporter MnhB subunit
MSAQRFIGLILLAGGVVLLIMGMRATESAANQLSSFFSGQVTDATAWYLVGGFAAAIAGLALAVFGGVRRR